MNKTNSLRSLLAFLLLATLLGIGPHAVAASDGKSAILLIGDGMGPQIFSIGKMYAEMELGEDLNMVLLANRGATGYMSTQSADKLVTDSAASGTAIACGKKTANGMVGVLPDESRVENILEMAFAKGKAIGVVTTTSVTNATPACFLAHHKYRSWEWDIAEQLVESDAAVILGGGYKFFLPPERGGGRNDGDLCAEAEKKGLDVVFDRDAMLASEGDRVLGLFAEENTPFELDRDAEAIPSLTEMTAKAIEILSRDEDGFVLMVEGGRIDHAEHGNDLANALADLLAFDDAVGYAMEFQSENPEVTVIVTADHDCGGPAITAVEAGYGGYPNIDEYHTLDDEKTEIVRWVSGDHTATMVPVFAVGPGQELFAGIIDNTDIHAHMAEILGLKN